MNEMSSEKAPAEESLTATKSATRTWRIVHFVGLGIFFVLFFRPAFDWAVKQLDSGDEPWQLVLVPFLSLMVLSRRVPELRAEPAKGCTVLGLPLMLVGSLLNLFGIVLEHPMPSQVGMIAFINGFVLFVWGRRVYWGLAFALLYLFLAVPLPRTVLVAMTGSLKIFGAAISEKILSLMGFALVREGAILKFPSFKLVVADECSGLQSLITLSAAGLPVAYLMEGRLWKKGLIVLISLPVALAANVIRLCVTAFLGQKFGEKVSEGWPHTAVGVVIVLAAFFGLYGLSSVISDRQRSGESEAGDSGT